MGARLVYCTAGMSNSWSTFTCVLSIPYLASAVKTVSQTKGPGPWRLYQYWAHTHQGLAAMGGTCIRLDDHRMPRQLLYGELGAGKRKKNRPLKRYKDTVKVNFPWCDIHTASTSFEDERLQRLMAACERRHRASSAEITTMEVQYPHRPRESIYYHTTRSLLRTQRTTTNF